MKPPIDIREHIKNLEQKESLVRVKRPSNKDNWRSGESPWFPPERKIVDIKSALIIFATRHSALG